MKEPIRVLQVIGKMDRGGAETIIMNLYRNIDRSKVQFDIVVHTKEKGDYDDEIRALGGKIYYMPQYTIVNGIAYRKAWEAFFRAHAGEYKIIHGHIGSCASIYLDVAKKHGLYTVVHSHSTMTGAYGMFFKALAYPQRHIADYFIGCSDAAGEDRFGKKVVENKKIYRTLNNGIECSKYVYNEETRAKYRKEFGVEDKLVIGHVGRLTPAKNHKFMIPIFREIHKMVPDSVLLLAGRGELEEQVRALVKSEGLEDCIKLLGVRDDVPNVLQAYDCFLFPSTYEGLPLSLVEAQAAGLPCIVPDHITDLAIVTEGVVKLSLNENEKTWADAALEKIKAYPRQDRTAEVRKGGFDIVGVAKELEEFYLETYRQFENK